jgi:transposase InsO family protein
VENVITARSSRYPRELRDEELKREIQRVYDENYKVYGARKIWWELHREDIQAGRVPNTRNFRFC